MQIKIFYDGQCPFCSNYVRLVDLRQVADQVDLVDLREDAIAKAAFIDAGYDLDAGMVVEVDGQIYHGKNAAEVLSKLSGGEGVFLKVNQLLFGAPFFSSLVYRLMRIGRDATLFILGRQRITEKRVYSENLKIFSFFFGVFSVLHFFVYAYQFRLPLYITTYIIPVLGFLLILKPGSARLLSGVVLVLSIDGILQAPVFSNHTILKNFLVLAIILAGFYSWLCGGGRKAFYLSFAPLGRALLLVMYFFGVFHKVNQDFLDPSVSCAVALWDAMPAYIPALSGGFFDYVKIYGTLIIESAIFICLLSRRFRNIGVFFGITFHSMLALSDYALYAPFSMLTVALHVLFLSPDHANQVCSSKPWKRMRGFLQSFKGKLLLTVYIALVWGLAYHGQYSSVGLLWIVAMLVPYSALLSLGRNGDECSTTTLLLSRPILLNFITIFFFLNCFSPYFGLKTSQSMNMFANLRLENGVSNHYVMGVPGAFGYLEDLVRIEDSGGDPFLTYIKREDLRLVYYGFIDYLERNKNLSVSYYRSGSYYSHSSYDDISKEDRGMLHPRWVRAWLHFTPVDLSRPKECALDR